MEAKIVQLLLEIVSWLFTKRPLTCIFIKDTGNKDDHEYGQKLPNEVSFIISEIKLPKKATNIEIYKFVFRLSQKYKGICQIAVKKIPKIAIIIDNIEILVGQKRLSMIVIIIKIKDPNKIKKIPLRIRPSS